MKKNKFKKIIYIILIIYFSISIVPKMFENDTYFGIAVGNKILDVGFYEDEDFTFVEGLKYQNVRWIFDITLATIYNNFDYIGIYIFVMIMAALIGISIYYILLDNKCTNLIALVLTCITMLISMYVFAPRAQIFSFFIFIWEYFFIRKLLNTNQKRYALILFILSVILANAHASVYPFYFVIFMPFIAEEVLSYIKIPKSESKIIIEKKGSLKLLIITLIITAFGGLITPLGMAPYINMFKTVGEVSSDFITEMAPLIIAKNSKDVIFIIVFFAIVGFTRTKVKLSDCLFIFGFGLLSLSSVRSLYFLQFIGVFSIGNILTSFYNEYELYELKIKNKFIYNGLHTIIILLIIIISTNFLWESLKEPFEDPELCPTGPVKYILENYSKDEIKKMRIYNGFNLGAYMEFKGLPVFMDSRAEIYLSTFNNTSIIEDFLKLTSGQIHYNDIFDKYNINYAILENNSVIINYIYEDKYWNLLYQDSHYSLYEKVEE